MMHVPAEVSNRKRSGSVSSVRNEDFKTMNPNHKFSTPRPAPSAPEHLRSACRPATAQAPAEDPKQKRSDRPVSPTPSWWSPRKLFTGKSSTPSSSKRSDRGSPSRSSCEDQRHSVASSSSDGSRTRAMSPDSLRKFLSDDVPNTTLEPMDDAERLFLSIPDDVAEDDDDNFATSAISENGIKTFLSPPPPVSRNNTPNALRRLPQNESAVTLKASKPITEIPRLQPAPLIIDQATPTSRFSFSSDEGSVFDDNDDETDSTSPEPEAETEAEIPSFYHSEAEEDDKDSEILMPPFPFNTQQSRSGPSKGLNSLEQSLAEAFTGYRLPLTSADGKDRLASPPVAPRDGGSSVSVVNSPPLLAAPVGSVVDDFVSEMSGCIQGKWI